MDKRNKYFEWMRETIHNYDEQQKTHAKECKLIVEQYGRNSKEFDEWCKNTKVEKYPFRAGHVRAYSAWWRSVTDNLEELEMDDLLFEDEVADFVETLNQAGMTSFVCTDQSTALMRTIHAFEDNGFKLDRLVKESRNDVRLGQREILGIRFVKATE